MATDHHDDDARYWKARAIKAEAVRDDYQGDFYLQRDIAEKAEAKYAAIREQVTRIADHLDSSSDGLEWLPEPKPAPRPEMEGDDEALARAMRDAFNGLAPGRPTWDAQDKSCARWVPVARAAREHIEAEWEEVAKSFEDGRDKWQAEARQQRDRAEKAEAERDDPTNDRLCGPPHCTQREGHFMPCDWDEGSDPQPDPDTVTLPREDAERLLDCWAGDDPHALEGPMYRRVRAALGGERS